MPKLVMEVPEEIVKKYNGETIEFFKRKAESKYDKFVKTVVREFDPAKDEPLSPVRPNVMNPNQVRKIFPKLDQVFGTLKNVQILSILNLAMSAANLAATIKGFQEINCRLDNIEAQLSEIKKGVDNVQKTNFELQIAQKCRSIVSRYKDLSVLFEKGKPISEKELIALIDDSKEFIISMYNLRNVYTLQVALKIIFMLFPVLANSILIYYQRFYDPNQQEHNRHSEWMEVFDLLSAPQFIDEIQDYMFIELRKTNKEVNEYMDCQRSVVYGFRLKIEDLLADLKVCGSMEVYDEAMQWSRQYTAQQARSKEAELEKQIGAERAKELVEQAMQEAMI